MAKSKENIMGALPVKRALFQMTFPIIFSSFANALYGIVDSIYVAHLSPEAFTAISLSFPIQNFISAVGLGTGIGMNALASRELGKGNYEHASAAVHNGIFLAMCSGLIFALFGIFGSQRFYRFFTTNQTVMVMGVRYMTIYTVCSIGTLVGIMMDRTIQMTGKTIYQMITQASGAVVNIILDPILIYGMFGCPELGLTGAAVSTVIGQWVGMLTGLTMNLVHNQDVRLSFRKITPEASTIRAIYRIGLPSILVQGTGSIMTSGLNKILISFSDSAVAVFGMYQKLFNLIQIPVTSLSNAFVPFIAFNLGLKAKQRILGAIRIALPFVLLMMAAGTLLCQLFPSVLISIFNQSDSMMTTGVPALRILSSGFCAAGMVLLFTSLFQGLGDGMAGMWMSIVRQILVPLPCALLLSQLRSQNLIWLCIPAAEFMTAALAVIFYFKIRQQRIQPLGD